MASKSLSTVLSINDSPTETKGSCLCGGVKYTITGQPLRRLLCHCQSCKKATGSSFMANEIYQRSQVKIQDPNSALKHYSETPDAGGSVERSFCGNCGSNIGVSSSKSPETMVVTSGTLDDEKLLQEWEPKLEFFCKRRNNCLLGPGADDGKKFDSMM